MYRTARMSSCCFAAPLPVSQSPLLFHLGRHQIQIGHFSLASLEEMGKIGVTFEDKLEYSSESDQEKWYFGTGQRTLSIITQNVDSLHRRAGSRHVTELHGRTDLVKCMECGARQDRHDFHTLLEERNSNWLDATKKEGIEARPDGDSAFSAKTDFGDINLPACTECGHTIVKPDVVFFGDNVPIHRVARCQAAVDAADGILVVGTSLAVYSAFRYIRSAQKSGTPIAILNVGETRAESEGLDCLKIDAPAGPLLKAITEHFEAKRTQ